MKAQANMILPKTVKQWTVQRLRTKQGHIHTTGNRLLKGKPGMCTAKRRAFRKYAHRVTIHLTYTKAKSLGYSEG
jgi:hypothetical protein